MLCGTSDAWPVLQDLRTVSSGTRTREQALLAVSCSKFEPVTEGRRRATRQAKHRWHGSGEDASSRAGHVRAEL